MKQQAFNERLNHILNTNPRLIYGAKWILKKNSPYWYVEFPRMLSGASFSGTFKITLGLLLELWEEFPELKLEHKVTGDILYVVQMGRLLSGSFSITVYNMTANRVDSFQNPTSNHFVSIDGGKIFTIFKEAQGRINESEFSISKDPKLLDEFLDKIMERD